MGYQLTEEYVLAENEILLQAWCKKYGKGLELEDRLQVARAAFLKAMQTWRKGYSNFHDYAEEMVRDALDDEKKKRNASLRVESPFSLDQPIKGDEKNQRSLAMYSQQTGDFVNGLVFRDFLSALPLALNKTANRFIGEYRPEEILEMDNLSRQELEKQVLLIRQHWEQYNAEWEQVA